MRYLLDRCVNAHIRAELRSLGYDCWRWGGDPTAQDKVIAAAAEVAGRAVISNDGGFLHWRRSLRARYGYHVHLVGRGKDHPALMRARIADLEAKIEACGPGVYIVEGSEPIQFEKGGRYNRRRDKKAKTSNNGRSRTH